MCPGEGMWGWPCMCGEGWFTPMGDGWLWCMGEARACPAEGELWPGPLLLGGPCPCCWEVGGPPGGPLGPWGPPGCIWCIICPWGGIIDILGFIFGFMGPIWNRIKFKILPEEELFIKFLRFPVVRPFWAVPCLVGYLVLKSFQVSEISCCFASSASRDFGLLKLKSFNIGTSLSSFNAQTLRR